MTEKPDARRKFQHRSPAEQLGVTPLPNAVLRHPDLPGLAKLAYALIQDASYHHREPTEAELGALLGTGEKAARTAIRALVAAGLVVSIRRGQGKTNAYEIVPLSEVESLNGPRGRSSPTQNGPRGRSSPAVRAVPHADVSTDRTTTTDEGHTSPVGPSAPGVLLVDGRNLPFDALADVCRIDDASNRTGQIVAALNTSGRGKATGKRGIRDLFALELHRWAEGPGGLGAADLANRLADDPEMFERALARTVHRKASLYRERMPGAFLTPTALRDHWLDLELADSPADRRARDLDEWAAEAERRT